MKLTGELKKQVEQTETREEAKKIIEEAGMILTDEEMEKVAGGSPNGSDKKPGYELNLVTPLY